MNNVHVTIKTKIIGRHMYNRFRNIKKIGLVLIGLAIVIFLIANVRIHSVDSYRKQYNNMADAGQTQAVESDDKGKDTRQNTSGRGADNNRSDEDGSNAGDSSIITENDNNSDTDINSPDTDSDSKADSSRLDGDSAVNDSGSDSGVNSNINGSGTNNDTGNAGGNNSGSNDNSQNTEPSGKVITCTIEIRCDNAAAKKDTITNPGIRDAIPDDGTILEVTAYSGVEGFSVYDVLAAVTAMHNPVIPIAAQKTSMGVYVASINNLAQTNVGPNSGWMYWVNGQAPNYTCGRYIVKDGDVIQWKYVLGPQVN